MLHVTGFSADIQDVFSNGILGGNGESDIDTGVSQTNGRGQIFTTQRNGGEATIFGTQQTNVDGSGPSTGNTGISGIADLYGRDGARSITQGDGSGGFFSGDGRNTVGSSLTDFSAFSNPLASGGNFRTQSSASSSGATGSFGVFTLGA